jgi:APA family basic amino acid/polyamine antiporter
MLVLVYGQTRIFYTMSRDGLLPQFFSIVHKKYHTPWINTMLVGFIVALAAAMTPIGVLGDLVSLGTLSAFTIVCISVIYLRYTEPDLHRPFRAPFMPWLAMLGIACCGYLVFGMFSSEEGAHIFDLLKWFLLAGLIFYFLYGQFHSKLAHGEKPLPGDVEFVTEEHEPQVD